MPVARTQDPGVEPVSKWEAQLAPQDTVTVTEGDSCVSIQWGKVLGVFHPGVHHLPAEIPDGVELWFCATRPVFGVKVGGRTPNGGSVFGDFAFEVAAPHLVIQNLAGTGSGADFVSGIARMVTNALVQRPPPTSPADIESFQDGATHTLRTTLAPAGVKFLRFGMLSFG